MNNETITIQDCLDMYEKKGYIAIIEKGQVVKFIKEKAHQERPFQSEHIEKHYK